ncbi:Uncharacterised protein [Cedecea neteri]|uniref:Uncharacterized protein n=1 Tax=Cedecea neteri TaxID=158822 RepID=A0A2X3IJ48_9ENTR|nr:Uncharacterised protein [Cedecea neteri]
MERCSRPLAISAQCAFAVSSSLRTRTFQQNKGGGKNRDKQRGKQTNGDKTRVKTCLRVVVKPVCVLFPECQQFIQRDFEPAIERRDGGRDQFSAAGFVIGFGSVQQGLQPAVTVGEPGGFILIGERLFPGLFYRLKVSLEAGVCFTERFFCPGQALVSPARRCRIPAPEWPAWRELASYGCG